MREPLDLQAEADPVAAFFEADRAGLLIGLRTSGTTDSPRLVVRSTESWVSSFDAVSALAGMVPSSRVWVPGPINSTMNLFALVHATHIGAHVVDDPSECTHAHLTPAAFERCLDEGSLPNDCTVIVAGDALRPALRDRAHALGLVVHHYYGSSEQSFIAWGTASDDLRAFPGVEIEVREGVIHSRSPYVSSGYAGTGSPGVMERDDDGWVSVGDRGVLDDGVLRVAGRGSDAVTTAGATVLVADIESVLRPLARGEVIVTGLAHERLGAIVVAAVTEPADAPMLAEAARRLLPAAQRPRRWFELVRVPLTAAGKIDREAIASLVAQLPALPISTGE